MILTWYSIFFFRVLRAQYFKLYWTQVFRYSLLSIFKDNEINANIPNFCPPVYIYTFKHSGQFPSTIVWKRIVNRNINQYNHNAWLARTEHGEFKRFRTVHPSIAKPSVLWLSALKCPHIHFQTGRANVKSTASLLYKFFDETRPDASASFWRRKTQRAEFGTHVSQSELSHRPRRIKNFIQ